jgi:hypothetical protein
MAQAASKRSHRKKHPPQLDLLPVMNLFCVIIPFLLLSASFLEIATITMAQTQGIQRGASGVTTNLARSEEERLQPKVIMTNREVFIGTTAGTMHVCYAFRQQREEGEVITYDFDSLAVKIDEVYRQLSKSYPSIDFSKITILTVEETRYDNIIRAIDVCADAGFTEPGLQVAPTATVNRATQQ